MAKFMGVVFGGRGEASRLGHSYIRTTAASWRGAVTVELSEGADGEIVYVVNEKPWHGAGRNKVIATGVVGKDQ